MCSIKSRIMILRVGGPQSQSTVCVCACVCVCEVSDKRNCIPLSAPGDKHYSTVEYAPDFFKDGATVPLVNFGFLISIFVPGAIALPVCDAE